MIHNAQHGDRLDKVYYENLEKEEPISTKIYASFCGTGKTTTCKEIDKAIEFECWKYKDGDFPNNYIHDIKEAIGKYKYIFISTDPVVSKILHEDNIEVILVYPEQKLKDEYIDRFRKRNSSKDFIQTLDINWSKWLNELSLINYCKHIVLKSNEYLNSEIIEWEQKQ